MSTLKIMGLESEFEEAAQWVTAFDFTKVGEVSFFETTIRDLAGMLSAYDLSGKKVLLDCARNLADKIMPAFEQSSVGIFAAQINLKTGESANNGWIAACVPLAT